MAVALPQGTKEHLVVEVTDALAGIASLSGTSPVYTVEAPDGSDRYTNAAVTSTQGMKAFCMIDTTTQTWPVGTYKLWLRLTAAPEIPFLGPHEFIIEQGVTP